jgi:hypothetical protein
LAEYNPVIPVWLVCSNAEGSLVLCDGRGSLMRVPAHHQAKLRPLCKDVFGALVSARLLKRAFLQEAVAIRWVDEICFPIEAHCIHRPSNMIGHVVPRFLRRTPKPTRR